MQRGAVGAGADGVPGAPPCQARPCCPFAARFAGPCSDRRLPCPGWIGRDPVPPHVGKSLWKPNTWFLHPKAAQQSLGLGRAGWGAGGDSQAPHSCCSIRAQAVSYREPGLCVTAFCPLWRWQSSSERAFCCRKAVGFTTVLSSPAGTWSGSPCQASTACVTSSTTPSWTFSSTTAPPIAKPSWTRWRPR